MLKRFLIIFFISISMLLSTLILPAPVEALVPIKIIDIDYKECPPGVGEGSVTSGGSALPATCYLITGKTQNTSGKTLYDWLNV